MIRLASCQSLFFLCESPLSFEIGVLNFQMSSRYFSLCLLRRFSDKNILAIELTATLMSIAEGGATL